jgi:hypothetical protein
LAVLWAFALFSAACGSSPTASVSPARTANPSQSPEASIEGTVGYPGDVLLAQAVYAITVDSSRFYEVETITLGRRFSMSDPTRGAYKLKGIAPGDYFVLTAIRDVLDPRVTSSSGNRHFDAAYTKFVQCGSNVSCKDHTLVPVHVDPHATVSGIDPGDWFGTGPNSYPPIPDGAPPALNLSPPSLQDPKPVATYFAQQHTSARYVNSNSECQVNLSCLWFTGDRTGHDAAYFVAQAGTNGLFRTCTVYLSSSAAGWQFRDSNCRRVATAFPAVGSSGQLVIGFGGTGCINVRSAPGLSAKVAACLPENTDVTIDDGPYYLPESGSDPLVNYWWHIANQGWVVHRYMMFSA